MKNITISVYGNVALANKFKKANIKIDEVKELVTTYGKHKAWKIVDKTVTCDENIYNEIIESAKPKKDIYAIIVAKYKEIYSNIDDSTIETIIDQYQSKNNRNLSINIAKRAEALLIAHVRHNYTDYDNYTTSNSVDRLRLRGQANLEARKFIAKNYK
jgi:hypothetical protein